MYCTSGKKLPMKRKLDWLWIVLLKNGPQNTRIPWNVGMITGMRLRRFSSSHRMSKRLFTRPIQSKVWIPPTVTSTVREAYFQVTQRFWKPCIWQLSKPLKMDYEHSKLGTGLRWTQHYVWGKTPGITESVYIMRRTFLTSALDIPKIMSYI